MYQKHVLQAPQTRGFTLVLRGGGALGAYQIGVYQALEELGLTPSRIVASAIGALTAAIIGGSPAHRRLTHLEALWQILACNGYWGTRVMPNDVRQIFGFWQAMGASITGKPTLLGFRRNGSPARYSDLPAGTPLRITLQRLVDFHRLNQGSIRLQLIALQVSARRLIYLDNDQRWLGPEHVMASAALPPLFPAVPWPALPGQQSRLRWPRITLSDRRSLQDGRCFVVDLWSPHDEELPKLPTKDPERGSEPISLPQRRLAKTQIIRLVYPDRDWEGTTMEADFSWTKAQAHWAQGYRDARQALQRADWPEAGYQNRPREPIAFRRLALS